jgi:hypothetical protein
MTLVGVEPRYADQEIPIFGCLGNDVGIESKSVGNGCAGSPVVPGYTGCVGSPPGGPDKTDRRTSTKLNVMGRISLRTG